MTWRTGGDASLRRSGGRVCSLGDGSVCIRYNWKCAERVRGCPGRMCMMYVSMYVSMYVQKYLCEKRGRDS